jgi:hypothetical protein
LGGRPTITQKGQSRRGRESGSAAMVLVFALFMVIFFTYVVPTITEIYKSNLQLAQTEDAYLDDIASRLQRYYRANAGTIDGPAGFTLTAAALWAQLGVEPKSSLKLAVSNALTGPNVQYHRFAIWLQRTSTDTTSMDAATGILTPGPNVAFRTVDGQAIETDLYEQTLTRMKGFAGTLEKRFRAKFESDPLKSLSVNHFRPASGTCTTSLDDMPCIDAYTDVLTAADFNTILSVDPNGLVTAWGQRFTVSNLADSQTTSPPYTMAVRGTLPWGGSVLVNAVQPLN